MNSIAGTETEIVDENQAEAEDKFKIETKIEAYSQSYMPTNASDVDKASQHSVTEQVRTESADPSSPHPQQSETEEKPSKKIRKVSLF